ncbi:PREDICTED: heat shock 70 kDa protein 1-like [Cyprinodon variegatus]|uniref:heat shock 70 kDa protein 1-like n=1 Tax=Cyprinodon variegatus TaxID=28743 RepID=UPI000742A45A|nr:PREDICTED: heat shock 70 kDa protein 1-like [Cyprinodon variegatus]
MVSALSAWSERLVECSSGDVTAHCSLLRSDWTNSGEAARNKIAAKNSLESYAFSMKSSVEDESLKGKISEEDKKKVIDKCKETISWLENNQLADKDEYQHQQRELEKVCNPIISKLYQGGMPTGTCRQEAGAHNQGPTIEEVD